MDTVLANMRSIIDVTLMTIEISVVSVLLSVVLGMLGAWAKLSKSGLAQNIGGAYTTLIRGVPDLVLMLLLFFGGQMMLNRLGDTTGLWDYIEINQFVAGVLVIGFIYGAYLTETFRGAYMAIPRGQIEAGVACGMSGALVSRRIIWPLLVRYGLPSFGNNWLVLLKTTALVSVLGLQELTYNSFSAGRSTRQLFTFILVALVMYLLLTAISDVGLRWLERKYSAGIRRA